MDEGLSRLTIYLYIEYQRLATCQAICYVVLQRQCLIVILMELSTEWTQAPRHGRDTYACPALAFLTLNNAGGRVARGAVQILS